MNCARPLIVSDQKWRLSARLKGGLIAQVKQLTARAEGVETDYEREQADRRDMADAPVR